MFWLRKQEVNQFRRFAPFSLQGRRVGDEGVRDEGLGDEGVRDEGLGDEGVLALLPSPCQGEGSGMRVSGMRFSGMRVSVVGLINRL
jgi:hypothetical protein